MDAASADAFGAVVRVAYLAVHDGLARSLLRTRHTGTTLGMHADVLRLCSAFIANADEITTCLREKNADLSDARRTAVEAELSSYPARAIALELANAPQDEDRRDARSQDEVCGREQHGAAQSLCLRGVLATAGTELFTRSFHLKALLRDRVLPPTDVGEWIFRIDRSNDFIRIRYRLAEADC
jgi:hypothetical protein